MFTLSEAWSGVNWADLMAAQGAFGTEKLPFYDKKDKKKIWGKVINRHDFYG